MNMSRRLPDDSRKLSLWTRSMTLTAAVAILLAGVSWARFYVASRQPTLTAAPERINPNTASMASMVRLPGIGKARALDIIHYRQTSAAGKPVFQTRGDMENVKGIGPKTAENIAPYLTFENRDKTQ